MRPKNTKLAIICATSNEYTRFRNCLDPQTERELKGRRISIWSNEAVVATIIHAGPGKIQCASATQLLIDEFSPNLVVDAGAAGSLDSSNQIGSVICAQSCYEYDIRPIEQFAQLSRDLTTYTIAADPDSQIRQILTELFRYAVSTRMVPSVIFGDIASGERNVVDKATREQLRNAFNAHACNWETAAVLKTAQLNGIGCLSFRVITDNADEESASDYKGNLGSCLDGLMQLLKEFLSAGWMPKTIAAREAYKLESN